FRTQQIGGCLEKCELIAANYPDLPEGVEASQLASDIKANPEWLAKAAKSLDERLSNMYLMLADSWLKKGKYGEAAAYLEKVQQFDPNTPNPQIAKLKPAQLEGKPNQRTDFKK